MPNIHKAFLEHQATIRRVIARYCSRPDDVEDLVQQVFLKSFAAELKQEIRAPRSFLLRVARNLALSNAKRHVHTKTISIEDFESSEVLIDDGQATAEELLDARRKLQIVAAALTSLPEENREALLMRKLENLRFKQIAIRLNVSVSTVEKRVAKALVLCAVYLRERGYDPAEFGAVLRESRSEAAAGDLGGKPGLQPLKRPHDG